MDENARTVGEPMTPNVRRWERPSDSGPSGGLTFIEDVKQMKEWVIARTEWLDSEIGKRNSRSATGR